METSSIINWSLLKNPVNWAIVILMWMIGAMMLHLINDQLSGGR